MQRTADDFFLRYCTAWKCSGREDAAIATSTQAHGTPHYFSWRKGSTISRVTPQENPNLPTSALGHLDVRPLNLCDSCQGQEMKKAYTQVLVSMCKL